MRSLVKTLLVDGCSAPRGFLCVQLVKEKGFVTLGIEVDKVDGALQIEVIDEQGPMGMHNALQENEANRVQVGDKIVEATTLCHLPDSFSLTQKPQRPIFFSLRCLFCLPQ